MRLPCRNLPHGPKNIDKLDEILIAQMFPRPGVQSYYRQGEKDILLWQRGRVTTGFDYSLTMMDLIKCALCQDLAGPYFPHMTEQTRNIYYMANTFQIGKMLQANFIDPINTQYAWCLRVNVCKEFIVRQSTISINLKKLNGTNQFEQKYKLENVCWVSKGNQRAMSGKLKKLRPN